MKILIVKTSSLGDLIHVFPVVEYLRGKYPAAQIDWAVEKPFADILRAHPLVDNVLTVNTRAWRKGFLRPSVWREIADFRKLLQGTRYDVVFDLQGNIKSGLVTGLAYGAVKVGFAKGSVPETPNILFTNRRYSPPSGRNIRLDYLSIVQQHYGDPSPFHHKGVNLTVTHDEACKIQSIFKAPELQADYRVIVCPGSMWANKQLSTETLAGFLRLVSADRPSCFLFAWGSPQEKEVAAKLQGLFPERSVVLDRLPLPALQNMMSQASLVVAMDSLPLHLAGTTGTPSFSAFGASSASKYKPEGPQHITLQGLCPYGKQFEKRCPILRSCPTGQCIKGLAPETLFAAFKATNSPKA